MPGLEAEMSIGGSRLRAYSFRISLQLPHCTLTPNSLCAKDFDKGGPELR